MSRVIKVLDGGFSTQLSTHVGEKIDGDPLWSARFLATDPDAIRATHLDFLRAGADIIETNTYQASISGFVKHLHITEDESVRLLRRAVEYAKDAVDEYKKETLGKTVSNGNPLIAGSCGPYGAALHDGSEYTGAYGRTVPADVIADWHRPRVKALLEGGVDVLALETIPCKHEALALIDLMREFPNAKAWLTFSCRDDGRSIAEGTTFQEVAEECYKRATSGQLLAVGVNCIAPQYVTSFVKDINKDRAKASIPLVVYPNSGEKYTVDNGWKWVKGESHCIERFVEEWVMLGVSYVGGCCRTYAEDVKKIRAVVDNLLSENHF